MRRADWRNLAAFVGVVGGLITLMATLHLAPMFAALYVFLAIAAFLVVAHLVAMATRSWRAGLAPFARLVDHFASMTADLTLLLATLSIMTGAFVITGIPTKVGALLIEAAGVNIAAMGVVAFFFGALLGTGLPILWSNVSRFFTEDIVPAPLRQGEGLGGLLPWLGDLLAHQALPGIWNTLLLTQIALVLTGVLAMALFPLVSHHFTGRHVTGRVRGALGHGVLVVMRSTPEYLLAFILLQLWGPSMLPAVVALALHNGGIIGHLVGRRSNELQLRQDAPRGINRYAYEVAPRVYGPFLALLFYRWEIIMRETAILGILGIATLGFHVDSAIQELRFDRALVLIVITALLNIGVDILARRLRAHLRLSHTTQSEP